MSNRAVAALVDEWSMVAYVALDYSDEDSVGDVLAQVTIGVAHAGLVAAGCKHAQLDLTGDGCLACR